MNDDSKLKANRINWVLCVYISENFTHQHSLMPMSKFKEATLANHHSIVFMYILCGCVSVNVCFCHQTKLNRKIITVMNNYNNIVIFDSLLKYTDKF